MPHSRAPGKGLFELRIRGKQEVRLFYGFQGMVAYIVHGYVKKTRVMPRREQALARQHLDEI